MRTRLVVLALLAVVTAGDSGRPTPAAPVPPGGYEIVIDETPCPDLWGYRFTLRGTLVLLPEPFGIDRLPKDVREFFARDYLRKEHAGLPNGCFVLRDPENDREEIGLVRWETDPERGTTLALFNSVDAGYAVELTSTDGGFRGAGRYWHVPMAPDCPKDPIAVTRVEGRGIGDCIDAARRAVERASVERESRF